MHNYFIDFDIPNITLIIIEQNTINNKQTNHLFSLMTR